MKNREWHQQSHNDFNKLSFWPGTVTEVQNFLILNNTGLIVAVGKLAYSCQKGRLLRFFFNRDGWRHQNGWIFGTFPKGGGGFRSASFKVCLVLIFLNTIVEKTYPESWNYSSCYKFHAQKALFKVPKICNINFWIEDEPPSLNHQV